MFRDQGWNLIPFESSTQNRKWKKNPYIPYTMSSYLDLRMDKAPSAFGFFVKSTAVTLIIKGSHTLGV